MKVLKMTIFVAYFTFYLGGLYSQEEPSPEIKKESNKTEIETVPVEEKSANEVDSGKNKNEIKNSSSDEKSVKEVEEAKNSDEPKTPEPPLPPKESYNYSTQMTIGADSHYPKDRFFQMSFEKYFNNFGMSIGASGQYLNVERKTSISNYLVLNNYLMLNSDKSIGLFYLNNMRRNNNVDLYGSMIDVGVSYHFRKDSTIDPYLALEFGYGNSLSKVQGSFGLKINFDSLFLQLATQIRYMKFKETEYEIQLTEYPISFSVGKNFIF